jgi:hypothetical protein
MTGASRQKKLRKYAVTVRRTVEFTQVVVLTARSVDEAIDIASSNVSENFREGDGWGDGIVIGEGGKAKVLR